MSTFKLDQSHSGVAFQIRHMMISTVKGEFKGFDVSLEGNLDNLEALKVNATIDTASINTNSEDRDGHLRSADFFDSENYPAISIQSESIKKLSDQQYELTAAVTIKDVTKTEVFQVTFNGTSKNPMDGSTVAGFDIEGSIDREDYGLTWNAALETGGVLVGKDVKLSGNFEFVVA